MTAFSLRIYTKSVFLTTEDASATFTFMRKNKTELL